MLFLTEQDVKDALKGGDAYKEAGAGLSEGPQAAAAE